jgi:lipopolysaccharide biosynthesis protein
MKNIRLIAFYLPQFHPIPQNDKWWGKGFTEWTNVTKAVPLFDGHYQPHLPTDLGFYDLRVRDTRHEQIEMARQYGIDGFCYHYYWFSGKKVLNLPLDDMLSDPQSNMPFCLCWANENWTRKWDGGESEVLLEQKHLPDDDLNFIKSLVPFFNDRRYIKINGAPFFIVYQPQQLPHPKKTAKIWRKYCKSIGINQIHICAALTHGNEDYNQFNFDSGVEFPPHNVTAEDVSTLFNFERAFRGHVFVYHKVAQYYLNRVYSGTNVFRCVVPGWDNTPRTHDRARILVNNSPSNYEYWLKEAVIKTARDFPNDERFVFINAWNEWAEGCHLEPDRKFQSEFLEATLQAKEGISEVGGFSTLIVSSAEHRATLTKDLRAVVLSHLAFSFRKLRAWVKRHATLRYLAGKVSYLRSRKQP